MTEPREPLPRNNGDFDLDLKKAILSEALGAFGTRVLADDKLFNAISTTLQGGETTAEGERDLRTDFAVTPNVKDGKYSLCLEQSAKGYAGEVQTDTGAVGDMFFRFTTMIYVPVCALVTDDVGNPRIVVDKPFVELALGRDIATEKPTQDEAVELEAAVRTILGGVNEIADYCSQRGVELLFDDFGCLQLLEEFKNTFCISE